MPSSTFTPSLASHRELPGVARGVPRGELKPGKRGPWTSSSPPDLIVSVEVRRFERTPGGTVELAARWTIYDGNDQTKRLQRETLLSYAPGRKPSTQTAVATMSAAVAALSREIATGLQYVAHGQTGGGR
jgi:hypothetical protein